MIKAAEFIGKAKNRIELYVRNEVSDGKGGLTLTWDLSSTVWAYIEPWRGYNKDGNGTMISTVTFRVIIRYQEILKNTSTIGRYKMVHDGRTFPISSIRKLDEDMTTEGRSFQEIICTENEAENTDA